jgi:hypothetical protein
VKVQLEELRYSIGLRGGGLHDIPSQDVSQTSTVNTLATCMLVNDIVLHHISHDFNCLTFVVCMCCVVTCECAS